jgi:hypothetical protein
MQVFSSDALTSRLFQILYPTGTKGMKQPGAESLKHLPVGEPPWATPEFSVYRGVVVAWDKAHNELVYALIDSIEEKFPGQLVFASEHEAEVVLAWRRLQPAEFATGESVMVEGDAWSIRYSAPSSKIKLAEILNPRPPKRTR